MVEMASTIAKSDKKASLSVKNVSWTTTIMGKVTTKGVLTKMGTSSVCVCVCVQEAGRRGRRGRIKKRGEKKKKKREKNNPRVT